MQARKLTLVEIGVGALPSASPVAPRYSTWFPVPFKAPDVPPANGVSPTPVADGVVLEWDAVDLEGVVYVISRSESQDGPWTEIHRTTETRYVYSDGSGKTWWFQITPTVRGKTGTGTVVGVVPPTTSKDLAEQQAKLAAEISARIQAIADEAAARAAGLAQAAQDLVAEALLRQQGVTEAMQAISAEAQARIDAILNEKMAREAAITREEQLRQSADESLARAVSEVAAGSGTQFDSIKLWPFNQTVEGWTGNGAPTLVDGWLRPANHATAPWVQSPVALAVDGSAYRFVKLRVKRVGSPTWNGFLQWITATDQAWNTQKRVAIPEPAWDVNGVATVDVQDIAWWPATVDAIRLQLGSAQTVANYYLIDYIAVGRPQPGASVALVQEETQARITADAAEALQRNTLAVQMRGNYTGTDPLQLTAGLVYEELKARVAADSAQVQRISTMEARMPAGAGSLATAASVTALQEATATTTNALAQSITSINVSLQNIGGDNLLPNSSFETSQSPNSTLPDWFASNSIAQTVSYGATYAVTGSARAIQVASTNALTASGQYIGVEVASANRPKPVPGAKYTLSAWACRMTASVGRIQLVVQWLDNASAGIGPGQYAPIVDMTDVMTRYTGTFTAPANAVSVRIFIRAAGTAAGQWLAIAIDNVMFQQGEIATNWMPSASELQGAINATASALSGLTTTVNQLGSTVDSQAGLLTALRSDLTNVSGKTDANASALQNLTTRVTTAEGKIDSTSTSVTKLQSEMKASLAGGGGMFPSGTFEQFADGHLLSQGYGTSFTVNTSAKRNGNRGLLIQVPSDTRPDLNADCYPVTEFIPLVGVRRLYVEAWAALSSGSAEIPSDNKSNLRIGVQTSAAGVGGTGNVWTTVNWGVASLSKTSWTKVSGYVTTNASAAQGRLFISLPGHATDPKAQRVIGSILLLDDIVITDVTEAYAGQQASEANAQAITGLTTRVANAEGTLASTASQLTVLSSTVNASFNRGENLNVNAMFDGDMAPFVKGNSNQQNGDVTWISGGGQQGSAIQMVHKAGAAGSPFVYANGGRWVPLKTGRTGRKLRTVIVAKVIAGDATLTARCRVRHSAGEGNNDQTTPNLTSAWQRFVLEHPVGDDRTEAMSQVWVTNRGTGDATVHVDRIEFYDVTDELLISANASATAGLTTAVNQQGSKLDATAQDLVSLKTQVGDVSASGFNQLKTEVTQQGQTQAAQAEQITGIQVSLGGKADASVVESMQVRVGNLGVGANLIPNSTFPGWAIGGWTAMSSGFSVGNVATTAYIPYGYKSAYGGLKEATGAVGDRAWSSSAPMPVTPGKRYAFASRANVHRCRIAFYIEWLNAAGGTIGSTAASAPWVNPIGSGGQHTPLRVDQYPRGYTMALAPVGAVTAVAVIMVERIADAVPSQYFWVFDPIFCEVPADATEMPAYRPGGLEASARWGIDVTADGKVAGIGLAATGQSSSFDVLSDVFRVSSPSGGQRTEYSDGNWRTYYPNGQLATRMGWWQ